MSVTEIQLFQILKNKLGEQEEVKAEFDNRREVLATKEDIANVHKSIYVVGLVQFLAIIGSVLLIVNFMLK